VVVVMTAAAAVARRVRRYAVVDVAWGASFGAAAVVGAVAAQLVADTGPAATARRWLLAVLVVAWGGRLAWHLFRRVRGAHHDDPRYVEMMGGPFSEVPFGRIVAKVFALQAAAVAVVGAPVVAGQALAPHGAWAWMAVPGVALWLGGLVFEAVGDAQLAAYRSDPGRGPVLDTGLWAWTRHPNYFGDACVWWGLWLVGGVASGGWGALATLPGPLVMTWFLTVVSGARLAERRMQGRPGWAAYAARTPMFLPRPPRR
jgi:steroid 5-alpha reductase family enzyme